MRLIIIACASTCLAERLELELELTTAVELELTTSPC